MFDIIGRVLVYGALALFVLYVVLTIMNGGVAPELPFTIVWGEAPYCK